MKANDCKTKVIVGYKLNDYNATYEKATFIVDEYESEAYKTLKVTDTDSGIAFIVPEKKKGVKK